MGSTKTVKGRGSRHFSRLALTRRMIGDEMWRTGCNKLWRDCLGFDDPDSKVKVTEVRIAMKGRGTSSQHENQ